MSWSRRWRRVVATLVASVLALGAWLGVGHLRSGAMFRGEARAWVRQADAVAGWATARAGGGHSHTGSARFDGEWDLVTCQMTLIGLGQVLRAVPERAERYHPALDACAAWLVTPDARRFGTAAWGRDVLEAPLAEPADAWLGYLALALGVYREVRPGGLENLGAEAVYDDMIQRLAARLAAPVHRFQTYPGETYPPDLALVAAALGQDIRATGRSYPELGPWLERYRAAAIDPDTGLLAQTLDPHTGRRGLARGSGTAFGVWALAFADEELSADLYRALAADRVRRVAGFGGVREFPTGVRSLGDIDSGPVLFGIGTSATGFALAGARLHEDERTYRACFRTAHLFGLPVPRHGGRWYLTGMPIGNALLLALMTSGAAGENGDTPR